MSTLTSNNQVRLGRGPQAIGDFNTRLIRANRAAMRILGIKPEEFAGTYGKSFIPDTPEAQRRAREALASIGRGTDTSGVVLELRRKDNGKPQPQPQHPAQPNAKARHKAPRQKALESREPKPR